MKYEFETFLHSLEIQKTAVLVDTFGHNKFELLKKVSNSARMTDWNSCLLFPDWEISQHNQDTLLVLLGWSWWLSTCEQCTHWVFSICIATLAEWIENSWNLHSTSCSKQLDRQLDRRERSGHDSSKVLGEEKKSWRSKDQGFNWKC